MTRSPDSPPCVAELTRHVRAIMAHPDLPHARALARFLRTHIPCFPTYTLVPAVFDAATDLQDLTLALSDSPAPPHPLPWLLSRLSATLHAAFGGNTTVAHTTLLTACTAWLPETPPHPEDSRRPETPPHPEEREG